MFIYIRKLLNIKYNKMSIFKGRIIQKYHKGIVLKNKFFKLKNYLWDDF